MHLILWSDCIPQYKLIYRYIKKIPFAAKKFERKKYLAKKKCLLSQEEFHYIEHPMFYFSGFLRMLFFIYYYLMTHLH